MGSAKFLSFKNYGRDWDNVFLLKRISQNIVKDEYSLNEIKCGERSSIKWHLIGTQR